MQHKHHTSIRDVTRLQDKIMQYIKAEEKLKGALVGIEVKDATNGEIIFEHMSDTRLRPASNMKILTTVAALSALGENYTFSTELLTEGCIEEGQLCGNLYLKGKGDPTLLTSDLKILTEKIKAAGINTIKGDIIGDDSWYDDVRLSPDMIWSDEHFYYGSQVSALTVSPNADFDTGTIIVKVIPSEIGKKPIINIFPKTPYVEIENKAETRLSGCEDDLTIYRSHGTNRIIVEGSIPVSIEPIREWIAVWDPTSYVLDLFKDALKEMGIDYTGRIRTETTPETVELLYRHSSRPLSEIIIPFMKLSNNGHGEMLVKEMGRVIYDDGSWEKGLTVLLNEIKTYGVNTETLVIRDGSGISHATLIPAEEITTLLYHIQNKPWFPVFLKSLPVAGKADRMIGGTLKDRLVEYHVNAKTGTIYSVSTLSGYLKSNKKDNIIFSILLNNLQDEDEGPDVLDNIVELIAKFT